MAKLNVMKTLKGMWKKSTTIEKVFTVSLIFVIGFIVRRLIKGESTVESFKSSEEFIVKRGGDIYDAFYVDVYDTLLYDDVRNDYEIGRLMEKTTPTSKSVIADIGCGTGHTVGKLTDHGLNITGIDISPQMIKKANELYPNAEFKQGDALKSMLFEPSSLTHITCLYFTIYMIKNKRAFFQNCMSWLMPGGYLVLHLVDREKFSPILQVGEVLIGVNPQDYASKRINTTRAEFENFSYKASFEQDGEIATLHEIFKPKDKEGARKNEHKLYMPSQSKVLSLAKDAGFIMVSKHEMKTCGYGGQYIYVLNKPM